MTTNTDHISIEPPETSVYLALPKDGDQGLAVEAWVTAIMDETDWAKRATSLETSIRKARDFGKTLREPDWKIRDMAAISIVHLLTAAFEHLHEREIASVDAAAYYALSRHKQWAFAGLSWLFQHQREFRDWLADHPQYAQLAADVRRLFPGLPKWLATGEFSE